MPGNTWDARERPLLEAIAEADAAGSAVASGSDLLVTGLPPLQIAAGLRALLDAGMIKGLNIHTQSGFDMLQIGIREKGRRAIGQWPPGDSFDALLALVEARLAATDDPSARSRLERLRDGLLAVGREVAGELIADVVRRGL